MRHLWTAAALAALLAGCGQKTEVKAPKPPPAPATVAPAAPTQPTGFSHMKGEDLFGYYTPDTEVRVGTLTLDQIHIGSEDEFAKWEGGQRTTTYAPVMLEFSDLASAKHEDENGVTVYAHTIRVLPTSYRVGDGRLSFRGSDPALGAVEFDGTIDMAALKRDQTADPNLEETVLHATLMIGTTAFRNLAFSWFGGD